MNNGKPTMSGLFYCQKEQPIMMDLFVVCPILTFIQKLNHILIDAQRFMGNRENKVNLN